MEILLNAFLPGVANGAYLALIYGCLSPRSVATLGSLLASLGLIPVTVITGPALASPAVMSARS
jgi:hypothetical protein